MIPDFENDIILTDEKAGAAEKRDGVYVHIFSPAFKFEERAYDEVVFDFASLTGRDMLAIEREMNARGEFALSGEISATIQARVAARAGKIPAEALEALPLREFTKITGAARSFLLGTD
jgi:hypothetical protein